MSLKILHTADIHIGLKFSGRDYPSELKEKLIAEPLNTLQRLVEAANERKCDFLVIAGDMFDRSNIAKTEVKKAADVLNRFTGTSVVVLPGNHDFIEDSPDSIWKTFRERMNEHLLIFLDKKEPKDIKAGENETVIFYPGACRTKHSAENMISWIKEAAKDNAALNIGVAHGSMEGLSPDMEQNYFPMKVSELKESGVDFWLLGHTHIRYPEKDGHSNPVFFMPSTPCPDGFDCFHEGFAWIIEIDENKTLRYESVKTGLYSFKTWEREIYSLSDIEKLKGELGKLDGSTTLMKLKLKGRLSQAELEELLRLRQEISNLLAYVEIDSGEVILNIDREYIENSFSKDSLPYRLLSRLAETGNQLALQLAHDMIEESRG